MTTVADRIAIADTEEGQSVMEFLLMLPVMVGLVVILLEVNQTIQMLIVDQQYARAEAIWLAFNSPIYPESSERHTQLDPKGYNQMMIGVDDNVLNSPGSAAHPIASTQNVTRLRSLASSGSNQDQTEPTERSMVRVRDTVTLCTQSEVIGGAGGQTTPILDPITAGPYNLPDNTPINWEYCHSGIGVVAGGT